MSADIITIAEAVERALYAGYAGMNCVVSREWVPFDKLEDLETMQIIVRPDGFTTVPETRTDDLERCRIEIAFEKRTPSTAVELIDEWVRLMITNHRRLRGLLPRDVDGARRLDCQVSLLYSPERLTGEQVFMGLINATYDLEAEVDTR